MPIEKSRRASYLIQDEKFFKLKYNAYEKIGGVVEKYKLNLKEKNLQLNWR